MRIRFTKGRDKSNTLSCVRSDGSQIWSELRSLPVQHDIIHYVVESTLGYQNAFFGLLEAGWTVEKFAERDPATGKAHAVLPEAGQTELLVGILQLELVNAAAPDDFRAMLAMSCEGFGVPTPAISDAQLTTIRREIRVLCERWNELPEGETMEVIM